jgi:hypothetical protein
VCCIGGALQPVTRVNETARYRLSRLVGSTNNVCKVNPNDEGAHNSHFQGLLVEIVSKAHTIRQSKTSFSGSSHFLLLTRSSLRSSPHRKKEVYRTHAEHKYQQRLQSPPSESGPPAGHSWHTCSCSKQLRNTLDELIPISSIRAQRGFLVHLPHTRITSRQAMIALRLLSFAG